MGGRRRMGRSSSLNYLVVYQWRESSGLVVYCRLGACRRSHDRWNGGRSPPSTQCRPQRSDVKEASSRAFVAHHRVAWLGPSRDDCSPLVPLEDAS